MREHFDPKPDEIRWTDDVIREALEEMDRRGTPSKAHTAFAVLMMMRDSYEITRRSANNRIAELEQERDELRAQLAQVASRDMSGPELDGAKWLEDEALLRGAGGD